MHRVTEIATDRINVSTELVTLYVLYVAHNYTKCVHFGIIVCRQIVCLGWVW